ncbi:MAG: ABC transporter substrate-binding protein [Armatimonadota bacterium]|nr:ABC transporter substrate-binding protein [Armatimonadota bacterium]MDR7469294.1 ABC transporter substrate-binding protein [Armatimonadota bacterium]MDR7475637.1 ABC transporter substrate-binding protein [Armatimonadota bacterium]MDR7539208.1 ABC transporter substrate-binding protein [Armatimonadota bacterium]
MLMAMLALLSAGGAAYAQGPVKITLWHAMGGARYEAITKGIAEGFNRAYPNYTLEPLFTGSYAETLTKAIAAIRAGNPPHIVQVYEVGTQTMIDSGAIIPVTDLVPPGEINFADYIDPILKYYTVRGKLYSMPFNSSTAILYYNKDIFRKAGLDPERPPQTFDELEQMGRQILRSGVARGAVTFGWPAWIFEQMFAYHNKYYANNENGRAARASKVLFDQPFGVYLASRWATWAREGLLVYGGREYAPNRAFLAGEVAMLMQSTSQVSTIERGAKFAVGTAFLPRIPGQPRGKSVIGGASLWVLKGRGRSRSELDAIVAFFKYLNQPTQTAQWHRDTGYFPATQSAVRLLESEGWFAKNPNFLTAFKQIQLGPDTGATRGVLLGNFVQIRDITDTMLERIFSGRMTPAEAVRLAADEANKVLDEYLKTYK